MPGHGGGGHSFSSHSHSSHHSSFHHHSSSSGVYISGPGNPFCCLCCVPRFIFSIISGVVLIVVAVVIFSFFSGGFSSSITGNIELQPGEMQLVTFPASYKSITISPNSKAQIYKFGSSYPTITGYNHDSTDTFPFTISAGRYEYYSYFLSEGETVAYSWTMTQSVDFYVVVGQSSMSRWESSSSTYDIHDWGHTGHGTFTASKTDVVYFIVDYVSSWGYTTGSYTLAFSKAIYDLSGVTPTSGTITESPTTTTYYVVSQGGPACQTKYCVSPVTLSTGGGGVSILVYIAIAIIVGAVFFVVLCVVIMIRRRRAAQSAVIVAQAAPPAVVVGQAVAPGYTYQPGMVAPTAPPAPPGERVPLLAPEYAPAGYAQPQVNLL